MSTGADASPGPPLPAINKTSVITEISLNDVNWDLIRDVQGTSSNPRVWLTLRDLPFFSLDCPRLIRLLMLNQVPRADRGIAAAYLDKLIPLSSEDIPNFASVDNPELIPVENETPREGEPEASHVPEEVLAEVETLSTLQLVSDQSSVLKDTPQPFGRASLPPSYGFYPRSGHNLIAFSLTRNFRFSIKLSCGSILHSIITSGNSRSSFIARVGQTQTPLEGRRRVRARRRRSRLSTLSRPSGFHSFESNGDTGLNVLSM
jgi:hypothetical protein